MTFRMDPRAKLYLLLLANLMLLFHVGTGAEAAATALCLLLFFLSGKARAGVRLSVLYFGLLAVDLFVVPRVGESVLLNLLSLVSVGVRMMLPCIITGAYAFSTTTVGELTAALRRMHLPESIIIPCAVVVRFFPTVGEDYRHIRAAMALRGIAAGRGALLRHPVQSLEYILMPLLMNSIRLLAKELRISVITTKRAYEDLERDGFILTQQGRGSFVAEQNPALLREEHLKKVEDCLQGAVDAARLGGIGYDEVAETLRLLWEG